MLTPVEQMLFIMLSLFAIGAAYQGFAEMYRIVYGGQGKLHFDRLPQRLWNALTIFITQRTTLKTRPIVSLMHVAVVWGFTFYFLVNALDLVIGFIDGFEETLVNLGLIYDVYRLAADVLSVAVLVGVAYLIARRFILPNKKDLTYRDNILLHSDVTNGAVTRDSLIVAIFILFHVGARFLGEATIVAQSGEIDVWMPFASAVSVVFSGASADGLMLLRHMWWWFALGGIVLFLPYVPYTKHAHLFMAPINYLTRPERTSLGEMEYLDLEDEDKEQFGANRLEDLTMTNILDSFACIMCNRCQDVCPAYVTGKELSPAAYEVNKRFLIKEQMVDLSNGKASLNPLIGSAISESAVWACTACGACIDVCPVGNEPMLDILDIRRDAVLTQGEFPEELQNAFNGMERQSNPWQIAESRFAWANGLEFSVPTVEDNPDFDILYWVGCAASYDPRAQLTARALVKVLHKAGVNFAVLGEEENCTGDSARRAGNEFVYQELAMTNVETLNEVNPPRIVVTCPHCLHNLGKEYHQFGGNYEVIHHTELIDELIADVKLPLTARPDKLPNVTFHDPCYLGRHNGVIDAPRDVLTHLNDTVTEMPRNKHNSFCCGAGGGQFWKEEEPGEKAVSIERYEEAKATGADTVAVGCPFCMQMFENASTEISDGPEVKDVVELIADRLE